MTRKRIGALLLEARRSAGLTQRELADRMRTKRTAVSRAEAGEVSPTTDFLERFAGGVGRPLTIVFGAVEPPTWEERVERARRAFVWVRERHGRLYPKAADILLRKNRDADPTDLYLAELARAAREVWLSHYHDRPEPDCRGALAAAAMYYDVIDWGRVRRRVRKYAEERRLDAKIRRRARELLAGDGPAR